MVMRMDVASFDDIRNEFDERVRQTVWCMVATVDRRGRPRTRVLHPIWEGTTGWIATNRHSLKEKHLARNPNISLGYWDRDAGLAYAECVADWDDSIEQKRRIWDLFKSTPPPLGYDPAIIWAGPDDPAFGLLKLTARRIEVHGLQDMMARKPPRIWRASP
jgi:general stress protein 26